jgi:hypothetical protein
MRKTAIVSTGAMLAAMYLCTSLAAQVPATREEHIARFCTNCATVQSVTKKGSRYQLTLRYASGKSQTLIYDNDPGFRAGDKVRVNDGVLTRDD